MFVCIVLPYIWVQLFSQSPVYLPYQRVSCKDYVFVGQTALNFRPSVLTDGASRRLPILSLEARRVIGRADPVSLSGKGIALVGILRI